MCLGCPYQHLIGLECRLHLPYFLVQHPMSHPLYQYEPLEGQHQCSSIYLVRCCHPVQSCHWYLHLRGFRCHYPPPVQTHDHVHGVHDTQRQDSNGHRRLAHLPRSANFGRGTEVRFVAKMIGDLTHVLISAWFIQGHRFDIYEGYGCFLDMPNTVLVDGAIKLGRS